ncbi:beta-1,3-glucosyltransferase isoform X2 [Tachysurus fulvidraco]|uniref:beta-1,3-glucosyltransferase isoform X2 n=1 Tax=Tachysurus fulvidraco TaxID=1234273 RepID=UPI000F512916|nr:beta-1,3-glucosyltransferase isoform X2 [Tachysurus fulvidraco]
MTKHDIVGRATFLSCFLLSFVPLFSGVHEDPAGGAQTTHNIHVPVNQILELRQVVFVIQSQKNSYHVERAEQRRAHLISQEQSSAAVVLLHELSEYDGNWGILPALPHLAEGYCQSSLWIFFLEEETVVNLGRLLQVLSRFNPWREWFLGRALYDASATIIHHYAFSEEPTAFSYPDFAAGWALSCSLVKRLADYVKHEPPKSDFTIDLKHEIALYIWEEGRGPALTAVHEFCSELYGSMYTEHCATTVNSYLPSCVMLVKSEDLFVAVKTCQKFHQDRVPVVKKTWAKDAALLEYYSDIADPTIPTIDLGVSNTESGHCAKTFAILRRFVSGEVTQAPWLLLVDDDTLISLPRLRQHLHCYDPNEAVIIGERYGYTLSKGGYSYITGGGGMVFSRVAVLKILSSGCGCYSADAPDDMVLGRCLNTLGLSVTHSPQFHQARPDDYPKELLLRQRPISFHKHWNINPVAVYQQWLMNSEYQLQQNFSREYREEL